MMARAFALIAMLAALPSISEACSCLPPQDTHRAAREEARVLFAHFENVVLLRAVEVNEVGPNHERAKLVVVQSWKGTLAPGDVVLSDTPGIGDGSCNESIAVGAEILVGLASDGEPIEISGCPGMFELTARERHYLDKLAPAKKSEAPAR